MSGGGGGGRDLGCTYKADRDARLAGKWANVQMYGINYVLRTLQVSPRATREHGLYFLLLRRRCFSFGVFLLFVVRIS